MKDFDILVPQKRIAKIGGEEIDVTIIPSRASLMFIDFSKKYSAEKLKSMDQESFDPAMIEAMLDVIEVVCKKYSSKITKDWLLDNLPIKTLMEFITYVFEGMNKSEPVENSGDGKN